MMKKLSVAFVLLAGSLWGSMGVFVHLLTDSGFSLVQSASLRLISAVIIMSAVILIYDRSLFKVKLRDLWLFVLLGVFSIYMMTLTYFTAIKTTSMSVAAILLYTAPIFVMLASLVLFLERLTWQKGIALLLAVMGCALVSGVGANEPLSFIGVLSGIASGVCYASYSIIGTFLLRRGYHPFTLNVYAFVFAASCSVLVAPLPDTVAIITSAPDIWLTLIKIFACGLVSAALPFMLYTVGLNGLQPGVAAILASVEPMMASLIGFVAYSEPPGWMGIVMILLAVLLVNNFGIKSKKEETP